MNNEKNKFIFLIPVVILLIGIAVYRIVQPDIFGSIQLFVLWLFTDPQKIVDILLAPSADLSLGSIGERVFWLVWLAGLIVSLFFAGKHLQSKPAAAAASARKDELRLMVQDAADALRQLKTRKRSQQLHSLIRALKKLEEKLSIESDFGCGDPAVIDCEEQIAALVQFLSDAVLHVENGDLVENLKAMSKAVRNIQSLLRRRTALKRR